MCGYFEIAHSCCGAKFSFQPTETTRCPLYTTNKRYCRTGSVHSWIVPGGPLLSDTICEECRKAKERYVLAEEQGVREEDLERVREDKAREERVREREDRRRRELELLGRNEVVVALRRQMEAEWLREDGAGDGGAGSTKEEK